MPSDHVYLASASSRRRELLHQIGVRFQVLNISIDEAVREEGAIAYVERVACAKAQAGWLLRPRPEEQANAAPVVLGADTAVILDGRILGKPRDLQHAHAMLESLSNRTHEVLTAVAVRSNAGSEVRTSRSEVTFRALSSAELRAYCASGEPLDKAGGYAIQGRAAVFVQDLKGSYSGVMGLPLFETAHLLQRAGVVLWPAAPPLP